MQEPQGCSPRKQEDRDGHREGKNEKGNRDGEEKWKVHHPPVPVCIMGDRLLLAAVPWLAELESANPAVLCSHTMGEPQNGQILPVHVLSRASEFAQTVGKNSTEAAISGTQRMRQAGNKVQSVLHGHVVFTRCVLPLPLTSGIWNQRGSNV